MPTRPINSEASAPRCVNSRATAIIWSVLPATVASIRDEISVFIPTLIYSFQSGVQTHPVSGMGRKSRLSLLVTITIAAVQVRTRAVANALHRPLFHRNVEVTSRAYRNTPDIRADLLAPRHDSLYDISSLEPVDAFYLFCSGSWEAEAIHQTHLP